MKPEHHHLSTLRAEPLLLLVGGTAAPPPTRSHSHFASRSFKCQRTRGGAEEARGKEDSAAIYQNICCCCCLFCIFSKRMLLCCFVVDTRGTESPQEAHSIATAAANADLAFPPALVFHFLPIPIPEQAAAIRNDDKKPAESRQTPQLIDIIVKITN